MASRAFDLGNFFRSKVSQIKSPLIKAVRGRGLLNAVEIDEKSPRSAWQICLLLKHYGVLAKPTHDNIIRFAPPLVITEEQLMEGISIFERVLREIVDIEISQIPGIEF